MLYMQPGKTATECAFSPDLHLYLLLSAVLFARVKILWLTDILACILAKRLVFPQHGLWKEYISPCCIFPWPSLKSAMERYQLSFVRFPLSLGKPIWIHDTTDYLAPKKI